MTALRLGSLFDGIGVFPLAAVRCGIEPVWASEIENAPISITKLDGRNIPPVHIITFGSPCQNLSQIGNRKGLAGEKSSLFFQAIRIIREMREATNGLFPAIAVWENVMGAFSSNDRMDFRAVLSAFTDTDVSMPASGRWAGAGMVRGRTPDLCWRLMDAQHWASPRLALEDGVPMKYFLSPAQCSHFLHLAEIAGCPPPAEIEALLLKQGGAYQSPDPFNASVCGRPPRSGRKQRSETASDCQLTLFPLC